MRNFINFPYAPHAATVALAVGNFALDTLTDVNSATAVLYVAVVLMSASFASNRGIILVGAACSALTILSFLLSFLFERGPHGIALGNGLISLSAIGVTTYLVVRIKAAELAERESRAQLAHVARLTVLGELTASIAHEVNQPLAAIVTSGDACSRWLSAEPPNVAKAQQAIDRIVKDANRASDVITRVRKLATPASPPLYERLNMNDTIMGVLSLVRSEIEQNHISLRTRLASNLPLVRGDQVQLQQVLINLIVNAIEALSTVEVGSRELLLSSAKDETGNIVVSVSDWGPGIDSSAGDRLFDAFYTTKKSGLGMGLAISRTIVESHGGHICAKPNVPRGASIEFNLPAIRERRHEQP
jgi:C4-dicarboxylate-specific signal transduction histidine kinase